jgi:hypothetical protein
VKLLRYSHSTHKEEFAQLDHGRIDAAAKQKLGRLVADSAAPFFNRRTRPQPAQEVVAEPFRCIDAVTLAGISYSRPFA